MKYSRYTFFRRHDFPFFIDRYTIQPGEYIAPHTHEFHELVFVLGGEAVHEINGSRHKLQPGDLFLLEPGVYHGYQGAADKATPVYNIMFLPELLEDEFGRLKQETYFSEFSYLAPFLHGRRAPYPYIRLEGLLQIRAEQELIHMEQEAKSQLPGFELMIQSAMIQFLIRIGRASQSSEHGQHKQRPMEDILFLLREQFNRSFGLKQFAGLCHTSPSTLAAKFKAETGQTFVEYRRRLQVEHACSLLQHSNLPIIEVAMDCGFNDISYFYRVFRKQIGCTPAEYRQSKT
jgi:AraC-like DNA-binding protein/quercetin dioxygenase-like cupin family protein